MGSRLAAFFCALALLAGLADADRGLWEDAAASEYERAMVKADRAAITAARRHQRGGSLHLPDIVMKAVGLYQAAAKLDPTQAEPHFRAAEVLYAYFVDRMRTPPRDVLLATISHWKQYEALAPNDPRLDRVLFRRSIAYTKLGGEDNYRLAIRDYESQLRLNSEGSGLAGPALVLSNAAELHMAVGNLERAITLYKRALRHQDSALTGYGLGLALWRYGQTEKALQVMRNYARSDKLKQLEADHVFFVPDGEIDAYRAVGYDALGQWKLAKYHYERFLGKLGDSRYAPMVRARLARAKRGRR